MKFLTCDKVLTPASFLEYSGSHGTFNDQCSSKTAGPENADDVMKAAKFRARIRIRMCSLQKLAHEQDLPKAAFT